MKTLLTVFLILFAGWIITRSARREAEKVEAEERKKRAKRKPKRHEEVILRMFLTELRDNPKTRPDEWPQFIVASAIDAGMAFTVLGVLRISDRGKEWLNE